MSTIITSVKDISIDPVTYKKVMDMTTGTIFTTFSVYNNFNDKDVVNRPVSFLRNLIPHGRVDKVIQLGYNGTKSPLVIEAELFDVDVILVRSMT